MIASPSFYNYNNLEAHRVLVIIFRFSVSRIKVRFRAEWPCSWISDLKCRARLSQMATLLLFASLPHTYSPNCNMKWVLMKSYKGDLQLQELSPANRFNYRHYYSLRACHYITTSQKVCYSIIQSSGKTVSRTILSFRRQ